MWGLYIHVPFCPTRCIYCDFYSQQDLSLQSAYASAVCTDLQRHRQEEAWSTPPATIYVGGGTPSALSFPFLSQIINQIDALWGVTASQEISIEANPEDITEKWGEEILSAGFNRVSVGIQSWDDDVLRFLHRRHSAERAHQAIRTLHGIGMENISIDLIFALPEPYNASWSSSLQESLQLPIKHLSAYGLIYEPGTRLSALADQKAVTPCSEDVYIQQYYGIADECLRLGLHHYEISNWAVHGYESRHNSAYWQGTPYLGIGPSAHSLSGHVRWANLPDLKEYVQRVSHNVSTVAMYEELTPAQRREEQIMLSLRTDRGLDLNLPDTDADRLLRAASSFISTGHLELTSDFRLKLSRSGLIISDQIITALIP